MPRACSILIPTFNGRALLEECLPSVSAAVRERGGIDEIIALDNASADGTADWLKDEYPDVRVIRFHDNRAIFALNDGAAEATYPYLCFLNNDMEVEGDFLTPLLEPFDAPDVFAVTGRVVQWDTGAIQAERRRAAFSRGRFFYLPARAPETAGPTLYALGGQSVFDRAKFLELGGLDPLFRPFYHEDLDLSWRAWKRGWRVLYTPGSVMRHRGAATAKSFYSQQQIFTLMQRNLFLFMWKDIQDPAATLGHVSWLPARLVQSFFTGEAAFRRGFIQALPRLGEALRRRRAESPVRSDREVFALLRDP